MSTVPNQPIPTPVPTPQYAPAPPYAAYQPPVIIQTSNGLAVGSMILGIVGIVFALIPLIGIFIAAPCAFIALILGIVGAVRSGTVHKGMGMAIAGIILAVFAGIMMSLGGGIFW